MYHQNKIAQHVSESSVLSQNMCHPRVGITPIFKIICKAVIKGVRITLRECFGHASYHLWFFDRILNHWEDESLGTSLPC